MRTDRLVVRHARPGDWPLYQAVNAARQADPDLWYTDHPWDLAEDSVRRALTGFCPTGQWFTVLLAATDEPVGYITLVGQDDDHAELGYAFHPAFRGRGYAAESVAALVAWAFEELGVTRVVAGTAAHNTASRRLLTRLGFREAGQSPVSFVTDATGMPITFLGVEYALDRPGGAGSY